MTQLVPSPPAVPRDVSRRAVVRAAAKLGYAAPVIVASYHLGTVGRGAVAQEMISVGGVEESPTCTPTIGAGLTPTTGSGQTPTPGSGQTPTSTAQSPTPTPGQPTGGVGESPTPRGSDGNEADDDEEILAIRFLPETGDGGSLDPIGPSCR